MAKASVKEQIFNVSHHEHVKEKLKALLTSELVTISEMQHEKFQPERSMEEEGHVVSVLSTLCAFNIVCKQVKRYRHHVYIYMLGNICCKQCSVAHT